jgi:hypothetical protein
LPRTTALLALFTWGKAISSIRSIDLRFIDDLVDFVRGPGFVLDFSDTSFSDFFASELKINIDDAKYAGNGGSKGKRLRNFLQTCDEHDRHSRPRSALGASQRVSRSLRQ